MERVMLVKRFFYLHQKYQSFYDSYDWQWSYHPVVEGGYMLQQEDEFKEELRSELTSLFGQYLGHSSLAPTNATVKGKGILRGGPLPGFAPKHPIEVSTSGQVHATVGTHSLL
ncbi:hypothetical protein J1N35_022122, partial [Gossypium stocksii]